MQKTAREAPVWYSQLNKNVKFFWKSILISSAINPYDIHLENGYFSGGILARQFLVPMLLGFKLNAATLIPIFFAILIFVVKKAFVLSKVALIIGSAYALGSLLFSAQNVNQYQHYNYQTPPVFHYNRYVPETWTNETHYNYWRCGWFEILLIMCN